MPAKTICPREKRPHGAQSRWSGLRRTACGIGAQSLHLFSENLVDDGRKFGLKAINAALEGIEGTTALHMCFGYAYVVKDKPDGYSFLEELEDCVAQQISIEAAQPKLDVSILKKLPTKSIMVGVIDLGSIEVETPDVVAGRIREALKHVALGRLIVAPDCGMKYLPRDVAYGKLEAMCKGAAIVRRELGH